MKMGVNNIANQGEICYKMLKKCQMKYFGDKVGQL